MSGFRDNYVPHLTSLIGASSGGGRVSDWRDDLPMALSVGALAGHRYAPLDRRRALALEIIKAIRSQRATCEAATAHFAPPGGPEEFLGPLPTFCYVDGFVDFLGVADQLLKAGL